MRMAGIGGRLAHWVGSGWDISHDDAVDPETACGAGLGFSWAIGRLWRRALSTISWRTAECGAHCTWRLATAAAAPARAL